MRRFVSILICLLLLLGLAIPAFAAGVTVTFTDDSLPEVGGTLTVDTNALMNNGSITSDMYNAFLEGNVIYSWYKNGTLTQEGTGADALSYQLSLSDQGCTFYVKVSFYEDSSFQESKKCGEALSKEVTIVGPIPEITTKSLPDATVGKDYYVRFECSDPDAVFSEFMGSQLSEFGLYLTQHGEIEGTPTKVGNCHINVLVVSEGGGENSFSFDLTVNAAPVGTEPNPTPPESDPTQPPASAPTDATDSTQDTTDVTQPGNQNNSQDFPWWEYVVIAVGGIAVGIGIAFVFVKLKKKG